jgi:hypothetical protein
MKPISLQSLFSSGQTSIYHFFYISGPWYAQEERQGDRHRERFRLQRLRPRRGPHPRVLGQAPRALLQIRRRHQGRRLRQEPGRDLPGVLQDAGRGRPGHLHVGREAVFAGQGSDEVLHLGRQDQVQGHGERGGGEGAAGQMGKVFERRRREARRADKQIVLIPHLIFTLKKTRSCLTVLFGFVF